MRWFKSDETLKQQRTLSKLYFLHNSSENVKESVADEEEKESNEAEDLFEMDCTKQFSTKNLRNTNTNTGELQKPLPNKKNIFSTLSLIFAPLEKTSTRGRLRSG